MKQNEHWTRRMPTYYETYSWSGSMGIIIMAFQMMQLRKMFRTSMAQIFDMHMSIFEVGPCNVTIGEAFWAGHTFGTIYHSSVEFVWFDRFEIVVVYLKNNQSNRKVNLNTLCTKLNCLYSLKPTLLLHFIRLRWCAFEWFTKSLRLTGK